MGDSSTKPAVPLSYLTASSGWRSWLLSRDHKRIALLYLAAISVFFLVGATLGVFMRLELMGSATVAAGTPSPSRSSRIGGWNCSPGPSTTAPAGRRRP